MSPTQPSGPIAPFAVGLDTMIFHGQPVSLASDIGALTLLHGALQSAIASMDDACAVEAAYDSAVASLSAGA